MPALAAVAWKEPIARIAFVGLTDLIDGGPAGHLRYPVERLFEEYGLCTATVLLPSFAGAGSASASVIANEYTSQLTSYFP